MPWQRLYLRPEPHGQGALRPTLLQVSGLRWSNAARRTVPFPAVAWAGSPASRGAGARPPPPPGGSAGGPVGWRACARAGESGVAAGLLHLRRAPLRHGRVLLVRPGHPQLHMAEQLGGLLPEAREHVLEHLERLGLVFVERVTLAVSPEADPLAEVVESQQVVLPALVEDLEQQALLREAPDVSTVVAELGGDVDIRLLGDAVADLLVGDALF